MFDSQRDPMPSTSAGSNDDDSGAAAVSQVSNVTLKTNPIFIQQRTPTVVTRPHAYQLVYYIIQ